MQRLILLAAVPAVLLALPACDRSSPEPASLERDAQMDDARLVEPEFLTGNVTCADVLSPEEYDCEFKIDSPATGDFYYECPESSGTVHLETYPSAMGMLIDWSIVESRDAAIYVVVKGGPNANGYDYRPDGALADEELHSPLNAKNGKYYGLSHISFCLQERPCELTPTLVLYETCEEAFDYHVALDMNGTIFPLPDPEMDVALTYDCGDGPVVVDEPVLPDGTIAVPIEIMTECAVSVSFEGTGDLMGCAAETSASVTVWPELEAQGVLSQSCDGTFGWNTIIDGGSGSSSVLWAFEVTDNGVGSQATSTDPSGTIVLSEATSGEASVEAQLQVTDAQIRDARVGALTCTETPVVQGILARRPLTVQVLPTSADGTCPADNVSEVTFDAVVLGGSGEYTYVWETTGAAVLDPTCAAMSDVSDPDSNLTTGCSFGLGDDFCAEGAVGLTVIDDDPLCPPGEDGMSAVRNSHINVTPDP